MDHMTKFAAIVQGNGGMIESKIAVHRGISKGILIHQLSVLYIT